MNPAPKAQPYTSTPKNDPKQLIETSEKLIRDVKEAQDRMKRLMQQHGFDPEKFPEQLKEALRGNKVPARSRDAVNDKLNELEREDAALKEAMDKKKASLKGKSATASKPIHAAHGKTRLSV
jgi:hypothetical protein